jgi:hypothetical protein
MLPEEFIIQCYGGNKFLDYLIVALPVILKNKESRN